MKGGKGVRGGDNNPYEKKLTGGKGGSGRALEETRHREGQRREFRRGKVHEVR